MSGLTLLVEHWGYAAIFAVVVLGNIGLPVPEETILTLAGYLVWRGDLSLTAVLIVGILSASAGDNLGYWLGRRLGAAAVVHYATRAGLNPARLDASRRLVLRYGVLAVFFARFLPGLRFAAGPVAGITGVPARAFFVANVLGASVYVPAMVGLGYTAGRGVGPRLQQMQTPLANVEHLVFGGAVMVMLVLVARRVWRVRRNAKPAERP